MEKSHDFEKIHFFSSLGSDPFPILFQELGKALQNHSPPPPPLKLFKPLVEQACCSWLSLETLAGTSLMDTWYRVASKQNHTKHQAQEPTSAAGL